MMEVGLLDRRRQMREETLRTSFFVRTWAFLLAVAVPVPVMQGQTGGLKLEASGFPRIVLTKLDPTLVDPNARRFQAADFDAKRNRVLFYPEGDIQFPK